MKVSPKKRPNHGYLYLIQVRARRPWLHKVGITQNPGARFEHLNDDNAGDNTLLKVIYVRGYERKEAWIKDYFSNRAYYYHPFRQNGATEVFHFTWLDLAIIDTKMRWWELMDDWRFALTWYILIAAACIYGIFSMMPWLFDLFIGLL